MFINLIDGQSKSALSVVLTDYYKSALLLYDAQILGSKLLSNDDCPQVLDSIKHTLSPKEFFEINALVDFISFFSQLESKLNKRLESLDEVKALLPNVNYILFANKDKRAYKIIFDRYPAICSIYYTLLKLKETMLDLEDVLESINFKENINEFISIINEYSFKEFIADFEKLGTSHFMKKIEMNLLSDIENKKCYFSPYRSGAICNLKMGHLFYVSYIQTQIQPIGSLSMLSHYIYFLKYGEEAQTEPEYKRILKLENRTNLDKLLFINGNSANIRLHNFLEQVAEQDFSKNMILKKGNKILDILVENSSFFEESANDNIFAIYMLYNIREKLDSYKNQIKEEITNIIEKNIKLEYRLVELELYLKKILLEFMNYKKIVSAQDEMETVFYSGIKKVFEDEIASAFNNLKQEKEKN